MKDSNGKEVMSYQEIAKLYGKSEIWFKVFKRKIEDPKIWVFKRCNEFHTRTVYLYKDEVVKTLKKFGFTPLSNKPL